MQQSPKFNLIEDLWFIMKRYVRKNEKQYWEAVKTISGSVKAETVEKSRKLIPV